MAGAIRRETGFLEREGERIYFESLGEGGVPLVLSHGAGGNHAVWFQQVPVFARTRRVVVWDHRGFGRSSDRARRSGPEANAGDLAALIDQLDLARVDLVGQSMGGWTAFGLALAEPARVRRLVLADTLGGLATPEIERAFAAAHAGGAPSFAPIPELGAHAALDPGFRDVDPAHAWLYQALGSMGEPDLPAILPRLLAARRDADAAKALRCPVLLVVGATDALFPPAVVHAAAPLFADARVEEIRGAGHSPYFEQPDAWNRVVLGFLG